MKKLMPILILLTLVPVAEAGIGFSLGSGGLRVGGTGSFGKSGFGSFSYGAGGLSTYTSFGSSSKGFGSFSSSGSWHNLNVSKYTKYGSVGVSSTPFGLKPKGSWSFGSDRLKSSNSASGKYTVKTWYVKEGKLLSK